VNQGTRKKLGPAGWEGSSREGGKFKTNEIRGCFGKGEKGGGRKTPIPKFRTPGSANVKALGDYFPKKKLVWVGGGLKSKKERKNTI